MGATTLRLPDEKLKLIRAIAGYEKIPLSKSFEEMVDWLLGMIKNNLVTPNQAMGYLWANTIGLTHTERFEILSGDRTITNSEYAVLNMERL